MAFNEINRNAPAANNVLELKSVLVRAVQLSEQLQREAAEVNDAQISSHYGVPNVTGAQWTVTINVIVTALDVAAVNNYISHLG